MHLGIDLGTSNSAVVGHSDGTPRLFKTADGTDVLPSVIYLDKRNHRFVGARAYDRIFTSPENTAQGFKRLMGTKSPIHFDGAGVDWSPEECSAEVLRTLVSQARTEAGDFTLEGTVVTIPAAFNQMQSEATIRATHLAGLERVTLVQEPVAAAMASVAGSKVPNGVFLVYDIGGGTFDVALVQSVKGSVTILAHEGINMLGGRDFDRRVLDAHVRPWLEKNFHLPGDFQRDPRFKRLLGVARYAVEKARIDLSTMDTTTIHAGDEEVRVVDADGQDIFLSIELHRREVEALIEDKVTESIGLCRKVLRDNGLGPDDVERVVLVGGPSKMPLIRDSVPRELGLDVQHGLDPMTAVATGASIFAAGRDWTEIGARSKPIRRSEKTGGEVEVLFDFPTTVADETARLSVRAPASTPPGYMIEVTDCDGVTYGRAPLAGGVKLELRLSRMGVNRFDAVVTDASGSHVPSASHAFIIERLGALAGGTLTTHTLAVKIQHGEVGNERNVLETLVIKGTSLPAQGLTPVRIARDLRGGEPGHVRVELFEQTSEIADPELALFVGDFRLDAERHLDPGERLHRGTTLNLCWQLDDNHLLTLAVEAPDLGRIIEARDLYLPEAGHANYDGKDGAELANALLADAEQAVEEATQDLGLPAGTAIDKLRRRLHDQHNVLSGSVEAEDHRSASEEARRVRQEIALLRRSPEHQARALAAELANVEEAFDQMRATADAVEIDRFNRLSGTAHRALRLEDFEAVERAMREMNNIRFGVLFRDSDFLVGMATELAQNKSSAVDKELHDKLVIQAAQAISRQDMNALRVVIGQLFNNRIAVSRGNEGLRGLADLLGA